MTSFRRRRFLSAAVLLPLAGSAIGQTRPLTCGELTARQTEGPFFKTDSPKRISLVEPGSKATRLVLTGTVLSAQCKPVPNALLDFWHSDEEGAYDNRGFRYRGHQHADGQGHYRLETIVPAQYPGRTRHIHVKVQAPGKRILTTQLYFPGDPGNGRDGLYRPELEMRKSKSEEASFDFVVEA
jgi:protocatechuate 3,4-dioxygenase beta subunit